MGATIWTTHINFKVLSKSDSISGFESYLLVKYSNFRCQQIVPTWQRLGHKGGGVVVGDLVDHVGLLPADDGAVLLPLVGPHGGVPPVLAQVAHVVDLARRCGVHGFIIRGQVWSIFANIWLGNWKIKQKLDYAYKSPTNTISKQWPIWVNKNILSDTVLLKIPRMCRVEQFFLYLKFRFGKLLFKE